ncbi:MAG: KamA family radical SAM protein [Desulfuromonadales bacterium]|nr:KamA family radical SAM protein [Desulfuromonadales bacterium]
MSWQTELADSLTSPAQLAELFAIDPAPLAAVVARYPMRITPHTLGLLQSPGDPIWRQVIPDLRELQGDLLPEDSLNEAAFRPVPAVVHRYPDRALLLVSGVCAGYCRFCTRKSRVGSSALCFSAAQIDDGIAYLAATPTIRDVILTGGDPLLRDDESLGEILARLRQIRHVDILRIGSRVPVTLPSRITAPLCRLLARSAPLYLNTHFNHPRELTPAAAAACARLADAGIVLGNQAVLLRGVNDDAATMAELCRGLLRMRVRPYYLHQLDRVKGADHFRVDVAAGRAIVAGLRGRVSGLAIPHYVVDPPDGSGKQDLMAGWERGAAAAGQ